MRAGTGCGSGNRKKEGEQGALEITIYQIDPARDLKRVLFEDFESMAERTGTEEVDASIYGKCFEGEIGTDDLEEIYEMFNLDRPDGYRGRSMSVSDVIALRPDGAEHPAYYYCDSVGFREIGFDESRAADSFRAKIRVVMCEPGKMARYAEIGTELEDLQKAVGGMIETYYPFDEPVCIVCNDEGKINGMRPNRAVYDADHNIVDIIFGPFFICDVSTPDFGSLTPEQLDRYGRLFQRPEHFFRLDGKIAAVPYVPSKDISHAR